MDVYAALTAPWETPPDVLLAAVHAARVMPRPESQQERYCRWSEEHVNYPAPLCDLPSLRVNPSSDSRQRALMRSNKADATDCAGESGAADGKRVEQPAIVKELERPALPDVRYGRRQIGAHKRVEVEVVGRLHGCT